MERLFVFHDPTGRRWARIRRGMSLAGIALTVLVVLLVLSLVSNPQLPALGLPSVQHLADFSEVPGIIRGERALKNVPFQFRKPVKYVRNGGNPVIHPRTSPVARGDQPLVFAFYVNWDATSIASLRQNLTRMTHLVPEWLRLKDGSGDLIDETDPAVARIASDAKLPVLVEVNNFRDGWQAGDLANVLNNDGARANLIDNIYSNIVEHKFAGVNIDFEELRQRDRERMVRFMEELRAKLLPAGYILTQSVPTGDDNYDLKRLGEINDYLVPMVYDEHYQSGTPGPVASEDWYQTQLDDVAKLVPKDKVVAGVGNYGYDWVIGSQGGTEVSFSDIITAARSNHASVVWDEDTLNPVLRYKTGEDQHEIWFLDAVTALNHINDVSDEGFRGVALWRLGAEDPGLWTVLDPRAWPADPFPSYTLFDLTSKKPPTHYGEGEVLRIASTPEQGRRNVWPQPDGNYSEQYQKYPAYYVVEQSGGTSKKWLTLSFDDGPSQYTPRVLDILSAKRAQAVFFVVGVNAEEFPAYIRREYSEGHTIGNHTYTHPNIAVKSEEVVKLELSTTLRLIERDTGRGTILFRPPYNADSEPVTHDEILPIVYAQQLGYVTIAESIDPRDWEKGITPDAILDDIVTEISEAEQAQRDPGHIILLHDAGGDRTATIAALPRIIDTLRGRGYEFVPLEQLMGKTRDQLMPVPTPEEARWARIEGDALTTKGNFKKAAGLLFLVAIYLTLLRSLVFGSLAVAQKIQFRKRVFDDGFRPAVSVVVAAYNEEKVIANTVRSVLENGYPALELIVVDDGSKDGTLAALNREFGGEGRVRIVTQANHGKAAALNHAIRLASNSILIAIDADTVFRKGTIGKLVRHFSDPQVGAVSGNARVGNRGNWLTRFQSIEYIVGFNLDRRALDELNAITVVPGAAGAWRKDLVERAGGFGHDTLAEDTDLTLAIRRLGYRIRYDEDAVAFTEAPETTAALAKQRFRWAFGTLQAAWKHRDATFNPRYGYLGFVALPSVWVFQVLLAALSPVAEISMFVALFSGNWPVVLLYYFGLYLLELATGALAYTLEQTRPTDLALLFFQRIYYRQLMYYVLGKSLLYAMRGRLVGWGKLERKATVRGG